MQRLRLDALHDRSGVLYLGGKPFNGIAYEVKSDRVLANYQVAEGIVGEAAEAWNSGRPRVLFRALTLVSPDETNDRYTVEGAYLDGVPYHGIAYAFDEGTGALLQEQDLHPTQGGPSREWWPSGATKAEFERARTDGTTESETWYENGQSAGIESQKFGFGYTPEARLRTLRLELGYSTTDLDRAIFLADSTLDLCGPGVTDEVVEQLRGLDCVEEGISPRGLAQLYGCTRLKKLKTRRNRGFGDDDVQDLLAHIPDCEWNA